jgi:hypothetical protein
LEGIALTEVDYVSMFQMLDQHGASIGDLATAIESSGIWTWDRYGRFKRFDRDAPQVKQALDRLALAYERNHDPTYDEHPGDNDPEHDPLFLCGWPADELPKLEQAQLVVRNAPRRPQAVAREENATLRLVEAMRRLCLGLLNDRHHPDCPDENALVNAIVDFSHDREGLGIATVTEKFTKSAALW